MRRNLCGFLTLGLAWMAWAQAESVEGPPQALASEVPVDVVVRGGQGFPDNLKASDFTILDNDESLTPDSARIMDWIPADGELRPHSGAANAAKSPDALSNTLDYRGEAPTQVTVLLWDLLNTSFDSQEAARKQVFDLYSEAGSLPPFGLYSLVKSAEILTDLNGDPREVYEAIAEISSPPVTVEVGAPSLEALPPPVANPARMKRTAERIRELANFNEALLPEVDFYSVRDRGLLALETLRNIAEHVRGIDGRKNIVWLADTFPEIPLEAPEGTAPRIDSLNVPLQLQLTLESLNEANVAVYPVWLGEAAGTVTMDLFAERTGGRVIQNVTDLRETMTEIRNETGRTYRLAFTPKTLGVKADPEQHRSAGYHDLTVEFERPGFFTLLSRRGYSESSLRVPDEEQQGFLLNGVTRRPFGSTELTVVAKMEPYNSDQQEAFKLTLTIDPGELEFKLKDGLWRAHIIFATQAGLSVPPRGTMEQIEIKLDEERLREVRTRGLAMQRVLVTEGLEGGVQVLVQDEGTGKIGSLRIPLEHRDAFSQADEQEEISFEGIPSPLDGLTLPQ